MRVKFRGEASHLLLAALLLGAGPARAQDYPASVDDATVSAWLVSSTNIAPATVVAVTQDLVVAIVGKSDPTTPGGPVRLTLREEVIAPTYIQTVGGRSSLMSMEIHCEERRLRMDERHLYSGMNLSGSEVSSEPSAEWVRIPEGSIMDEVARAACDAGYLWPLRSAAAGVPASNMSVATLDTPAPLLPPGPDAKVMADEPPPAEQKSVAPEPPAGPGPEVVAGPEIAADAASPVELASPPPAEQVAPVVAAEADAAPLPPEQTVAALELPPEPAEAAPVQAEPAASDLSTPAAPAANIDPGSAIEPPAPETPVPPARQTPPETVAPSPGGLVFAVQIGAYETRESAEAAWAALSANRPVLVEGLTFEIRPVRVKGKDWLRGLVGRFASRQNAGAFCTALAGTEYGCILRTLAD